MDELIGFNLKNDNEYFYLDDDAFPQYKEKYFYFSYPDTSNILDEQKSDNLAVGICMKKVEDEYLLSDTVFLDQVNNALTLLINAFVGDMKKIP